MQQKIFPVPETLLTDTFIRSESRIAIFEDNAVFAEELRTHFVSDGFSRKNIDIYDNADVFLRGVFKGTIDPLQYDLYSVDNQFNGWPTSGLQMIAELLKLRKLSEKNCFIMVSGELTREKALEVCANICEVFPKRSMNGQFDFRSYLNKAVEILQSSSRMLDLFGPATELLPVQETPTISIPEKHSAHFRELVEILNGLEATLAKQVHFLNRWHILKRSFINTMSYMFIQAPTIRVQTANAITETEYSLAYFALKGIFNNFAIAKSTERLQILTKVLTNPWWQGAAAAETHTKIYDVAQKTYDWLLFYEKVRKKNTIDLTFFADLIGMQYIDRIKFSVFNTITMPKLIEIKDNPQRYSGIYEKRLREKYDELVEGKVADEWDIFGQMQTGQPLKLWGSK